MLGGVLQKGDTPQLKNALEEAGKSNVLSDLPRLFSDNMCVQHKSVSNDFLNAIFGNRTDDFASSLASGTGLTTKGASRLTSLIAPIVAAFLGNKLATNGYSLSGLLSQLREEKNTFVGYIPSAVASKYGFSTLTDTNKKTVYETPITEKKGSGWWKWLLLIALLLLLFFWWRSCHDRKVDHVYGYDETTVVKVDTTDYDRPVATNARTYTDLRLPDSTTLHVYKGGIEEKMVNYLNSNDYTNVSEDELNKKWFEFDNVNFAFGSSTEFVDGSEDQIRNIAAILKSYPNAKIKIEGKADRRGSDEANMQISRARAKTIQSILARDGVGSQVVAVEGLVMNLQNMERILRKQIEQKIGTLSYGS
ncbi:MAG: OmpA family protein [Tannerellaceae bacterium]|nr:OmpA family protein [Tannerellaceae bacterium]